MSVTLLAGLMAAAAFGFSALQRNAQLNEGVERVETAMRFARAHAANTGRKVQVVVNTSEAGAATVSSGSIGDTSGERSEPAHSLSILCEADPTRAPGVFEPIPSLSADMADVGDLIEIRSIDRDSAGNAQAAADQEESSAQETSSAPTLATADTRMSTPEAESVAVSTSAPSGSAARELPPGEATITFYPDGSCDGATLVLASRDLDDAREVAVHLESVTGTTRRQWREPTGSTAGETTPALSGIRPSRNATDRDASVSSVPRTSPKSRR